MTEIEESTSEESPSKKPRLSEEEYRLLVKKLRTRHKLLSKLPCLFLAEVGQAASLNQPRDSRVPIYPREIQSLVTYSVVGDESRNFPFTVFKISKWTALTNVTVLAVDNVGIDDFENNPEIFSHTNKIFQHKLEMSNPALSKGNLSIALAYIPLTVGHIYTAAQACRTLDNAVKSGYIHNIKTLTDDEDSDDDSMDPKSNKAVVLKKLQYQSALYHKGRRIGWERRRDGVVVKESEAIRGDEPGLCGDMQSTSQEVESSSGNPLALALKTAEKNATPCSRLDLLLNESQMIRELIPVPGAPQYQEFLMTSEEYKPVTDSSPMFSIDCEWVICRGGIKGLARIAVVDERLECVYHTLVKPILPVSDYLTKYSGVTGKMLNQVQTTLKDVQRELRKLLPPDAIIVGQAIGGDLNSLELFHPYIIDTSVIYNLTGDRSIKTKLSMLTEILLQRKIQMATDGHSPVEDATAAMELVLLKLKMGKDFGDVILNPERNIALPSGDDLFKIKFLQLNELFQKVDYKMTPEEERIYETSCRLHQKIFTFLESHNISSLLITDSDRVGYYRPTLLHLRYQPQLMAKKRWDRYHGPVRIVEVGNLKNACTETVSNAGREKIMLVHTELKGDAQPSEKRHKKFKKLDKAIGKIFESVPVNGLFIVIFSGTEEPFQNGMCFVRVNQQVIDLTGLTTSNQPQTVSGKMS